MHRAQPSLVSLEAEGWAVVSSGWGWEPVSSLRLVCPSGRQNPNHPERSLSSWHWSYSLPQARGWWCQGRE